MGLSYTPEDKEMNQTNQAPYVRATDLQQDDDTLFYADRVVGYVVTLLAGIGIGATITAVCVWVAVRGGV